MKRVEFHQARIVVIFRIVDDNRSYGMQQAQLDVLIDTDAEWAAAREQIEKARTELEQKANADSN